MSDVRRPDTSTPAVESVIKSEETWRTRPESAGVFIGNLLICTLFGFFMLWFVPKYLLRREYLKATLCLIVPLLVAATLAMLVA